MTHELKPLNVTDENAALVTDLYELTMMAGYVMEGMTAPATFDLFIRKLPAKRGYLLAAGLEQAVHYLTRLRFSGRAIDYLRTEPVFEGVGDRFWDYLREFRFTGDVQAMPEGTVAFPNEPLVRVSAPLPEAQIVETYLLTTVVFQTLIASKAARVVQAAQGRPVVDFGTRRAHGPQAGVLAARACYLAGCAGTSNVLAGRELGIRIFGTQAHSWVMAHGTEEAAFRAFHRHFAEHTTLLIDTYDTVQGARTATTLGPSVGGVRLDSGDLAELSKQVRAILDEAGMQETRVIASSDLNEYRIADLLEKDAKIDGFGVGTEMVTSADAPSLSGVYKLVEQQLDGEDVPRVKRSADKQTYPGRKQVVRQSDDRGRFQGDVVALEHEDLDGTPLLVPVLRGGKPVGDLSTLEDARERAARELESLPAEYKTLQDPAEYPVQWSKRLDALRREAIRIHEHEEEEEAET